MTSPVNLAGGFGGGGEEKKAREITECMAESSGLCWNEKPEERKPVGAEEL